LGEEILKELAKETRKYESAELTKILKKLTLKYMEKKQEIHFIDLKNYMKGRDWEDLTEEEQLEICRQIVNILKSTYQNSSKQSEKSQKDSK